MTRRITIQIDQLGRPRIEAHGFSGGSCTDATKAIETALAGPGGVERVLKPEWGNYEEAGQHEHETQW